MEELYLPPLISDEIAKVSRSIVDIIKRRAKEKIEEKQMPFDQKALMKKFGFDRGYKEVRASRARVSKTRKRNVRRPDVYEILEQEKEYLK